MLASAAPAPAAVTLPALPSRAGWSVLYPQLLPISIPESSIRTSFLSGVSGGTMLFSSRETEFDGEIKGDLVCSPVSLFILFSLRSFEVFAFEEEEEGRTGSKRDDS